MKVGSPLHAYAALKRGWRQHQLKDARFAFLYEAPPPGEWVAIDCEATGFDAARDDIVAIAAVPIVGNRVLTSRRLELRLRGRAEQRASAAHAAGSADREQALHRLLHHIGSRPLVGYYLEFDVALLNRAMRPLLGAALPNAQIDVSAMYYELKNSALPSHERGEMIDLRFATIASDLKLPRCERDDAIGNAVRTALAFVKMRHLLGQASS